MDFKCCTCRWMRTSETAVRSWWEETWVWLSRAKQPGRQMLAGAMLTALLANGGELEEAAVSEGGWGAQGHRRSGSFVYLQSRLLPAIHCSWMGLVVGRWIITESNANLMAGIHTQTTDSLSLTLTYPHTFPLTSTLITSTALTARS